MQNCHEDLPVQAKHMLAFPLQWWQFHCKIWKHFTCPIKQNKTNPTNKQEDATTRSRFLQNCIWKSSSYINSLVFLICMPWREVREKYPSMVTSELMEFTISKVVSVQPGIFFCHIKPVLNSFNSIDFSREDHKSNVTSQAYWQTKVK